MQSSEHVILREFEVLNCSTEPDFYGGPAVVGSRGEKIVEQFKSLVKAKIIKKVGFDLEFDLVGVDPSLANAIRRIILSDLPSMAIEKVHIYNNTSIIQDEVLAHRLGLIPLRADPRKFEYKIKKEEIPKEEDELVLEDAGKAEDALEFELKIRCKRNPNAPENSKNPNELYIDNNVYTKHIKWIPKPGQEILFKGTKGPGPVDDDILIAKLRPGHEMDIKLYAYKGLGRDHAKFSPVSTVFYRLHPEIIITYPILGERAQMLKSCFSPGVIEVEDYIEEHPITGQKVKTTRAVVADPRYDACSRNVYRFPDLARDIVMRKRKDHFIFTVESCGAVQPEELVIDSIKFLAERCDFYLKELEEVET